MGEIFTYDNIYLCPAYSELNSRSEADTSVKFLGRGYRLPVIPANMEDVIGIKNAKELSDGGYCYIMHRFKNQTEDLLNQKLNYYNISIGVSDESKTALEKLLATDSALYDRIDTMTIDVAHGHHKNVSGMLFYLRDIFDGWGRIPNIIAGNVATADGYKFLCDLGVNAVKVGIGGGSICTTKYQTGFHLPTAYSVYKCAQTDRGVPIIADGGAKYFGDIAKALTLGASMVMSGGWFASCIDSPASIVNGKKLYRGSTSFESKGHTRHIEGRVLELNEGITYIERMEEIRQALCSSISYAGGTDLSAFKNVDYEIS